ncbi:hypothetical protein AAFF_G00341930 [Aldrovandia affinis]|uniref:Uncharacterized protein n=1 Tax=Aldrovandia affinis TaxID=143900 RepID=A0AAD7SKQ5_9TELE|nr:hypothetical protein AAFF_G00341930 [Aldrovandia affinis]
MYNLIFSSTFYLCRRSPLEEVQVCFEIAIKWCDGRCQGQAIAEANKNKLQRNAQSGESTRADAKTNTSPPCGKGRLQKPCLRVVKHAALQVTAGRLPFRNCLSSIFIKERSTTLARPRVATEAPLARLGNPFKAALANRYGSSSPSLPGFLPACLLLQVIWNDSDR